MSARWRVSLSAMALALLGANAEAKSPQCAGPAETASVELIVRSFFEALERDDLAAIGRLTTKDFYAFDAGKRFTAGELAALVRDAHLKGVQLNWKLGAIDTNVGCDMAWTAWENHGSAGIPPKLEPVSWLESAVLRRTSAGWRIDFFHSARVPPPKVTGR